MIPFVAAFLVTVALLVAAMHSGHHARRRRHLVLVGLTVVALVGTIYLATRLGTGYDLASAGWITPVHLAIARVAAISFVVPAALGALTWTRGRWRRWHRFSALLSFLLTVAAAITGIAMVTLSTPR